MLKKGDTIKKINTGHAHTIEGAEPVALSATKQTTVYTVSDSGRWSAGQLERAFKVV